MGEVLSAMNSPKDWIPRYIKRTFTSVMGGVYL